MLPNDLMTGKNLDSRLQAIESALKDLSGSLKERNDEIGKKLEQVIKSQEFISCQYDDLRRLTDNLMKTNQELQAENERLKETCRLTKKSANEAVAAVNELEQYGRREMIEIAGIPRLEDENVEQTVIKLCSHLNSTIEDTDIEAAHRISSRESASIIVKFKSRKMRNHVYKMRNMLKSMTTHSIGIAEERASSRIFINESLSKRNKELFAKTQEFRKSRHYKFLWTKNGNIMLRETETSNIIRIKEESDLSKLNG